MMDVTNFAAFLRKEKGLSHFMLWMRYKGVSVEQTLNNIAFGHHVETHLRNMETLYEAMINGVEDPRHVTLPFYNGLPTESMMYRPSNESMYPEIIVPKGMRVLVDNDRKIRFISERFIMEKNHQHPVNDDEDEDYSDMPDLVPASTVKEVTIPVTEQEPIIFSTKDGDVCLVNENINTVKKQVMKCYGDVCMLEDAPEPESVD